LKETVMNSWLRSLFGAVMGITLLGSTVGGSASPFRPAVPDWAQRHTKQWYAAFNAGDAAAITRLYAADAVMLLQGQTFEGRAAIEAFHKANFEKARFDCTWTIEGMSTVDKVAVVWGDDSCIDTPRTGGAPVRWKGRWLMVYQLQPDGSWMIVRDSGEQA
jgi:uncharacterized protein (TIGR02246 family)